MESSNQPVSPLRQRMLEDMRMRQLAPKTQSAYIRAVSRFGEFLGKFPTLPALKTFAAFNCTWSMQAPRPLPSTQRSPA